MNLNEKMERYIDENWEGLKQLVRDLCAIPAPSHHEERRAEFCKAWFESIGAEGVYIDDELNCVFPYCVTEDNELTAWLAHTDTVFPELEPLPFREDDEYMYCPGVCDDTANLAVLMYCAKYFVESGIKPSGGKGILFVANSCEEGLGNLKGSKAIVARYGSRMTDFVSFDGLKLNHTNDDCVGSHRYSIIVKTEGGHSYLAFGNRNAIYYASMIIASLYAMKVPVIEDSRTTYNVGTINGGTSVNTIAQNVTFTYEYRSSRRECLAQMKDMFEKVIAAYGAMGIEVEVDMIGDRPCKGDVYEKRLRALADLAEKSANDVLGLKCTYAPGSTDCNSALAAGIPAICIGVCTAWGIHTREEYMDIASLKQGCRMALDFMAYFFES